MTMLKKIVGIIKTHRTAIVMCILTMVLLFLFVENNGDGYIYQQEPDIAEDSEQVYLINEETYTQSISFPAHDLEYLTLRFDLKKDQYDYSQSDIKVVLRRDEGIVGEWTIFPEQIPNSYPYYIPTSLHDIASGDVELFIVASGEAPVGLLVGNSHGRITADYRMVFDSYSRAKLLLIAFGITVLLFAVYTLFLRGKSVERSFVFLYLTLGILYLIVCPILSEPDAKNHYCRAYEVSEGTLISPVNTEGDAENTFSIPEGWTTESDSILVSLYETWYQREFVIEEETQELYQYNNMALYSPVSYLPQAFSFAFARLFTGNFLFSVMLARIFNFLFSAVLFYLAIKLTPIGKQYILWISMLPMTLELGASISCDTVVTALVCLLISMVCRFRYTDRIITVPELVLLYLTALFLSQYKIVYVVFCLLLFLIPQKAFGGRKQYITHAVILGSLVAIASLVWLHISGDFLSSHFLLSNYQKDFILNNPLRFVLVLINTVLVYGADILHTMAGSNLGALSFTTNLFLVILLLSFVFAWILRERLENEKDGSKDTLVRWIFALVTAFSALLILTSEYLQWNDVGEKAIGGLQGRYFIPLLFPICLLVTNALKNKNADPDGGVFCAEKELERKAHVPMWLMLNLCFGIQLFMHFIF